MVTISIPQEPHQLIGPIFHRQPEPPMSSPSSIHTLSSPLVSYATTTASQRLTKNQSISTDTTPQSSKATVFQMVSGAYPSIPPTTSQCTVPRTNTTGPCSMAPHLRLQSKYQHFPRGQQMNLFVIWPNLAPQVIRRYLQHSISTAKDHLHQQ